MSYTWEGYALDPSALVEEIRTPGIGSATTGLDRESADALRDLVRAGGGDVTGNLASQVVVLVRHLGRLVGSVGHSSSGGDWFRRELLGTQAAAVLGFETVSRLLVRELGGLRLLDYPMLGWLDRDECRVAAEAIESAAPEDAEEELWQLLDTVTVAARLDLGLVTIYL